MVVRASTPMVMPRTVRLVRSLRRVRLRRISLMTSSNPLLSELARRCQPEVSTAGGGLVTDEAPFLHQLRPVRPRRYGRPDGDCMRCPVKDGLRDFGVDQR